MRPARADLTAARHCIAGRLVAEELTPVQRELVVSVLHARGYPDARIAAVTRMSSYTTGRIRLRLGLTPHRPAAAGC
ncbi:MULTISPECIES: hypothetical protein [unclassified Crossiella]|uniref:hypothetical protein n=1 Tax=unclassified Crossiella TaxID=2620835 RepID=UPI001FFE2F66|nr:MULTISPECIES: hypothetical protein [unclassified Crossiella]MCK2242336.1 hypothetical protein [Crossiella sp. S99.2]MCK2254633.1 hypothetical protein [Crossiella sp. S99.1]